MNQRIKHKIWLAWSAILWERLWRALWPAVTALGLAISVALLDLLPDLPGWLHASLLLAAMGGLAAALWGGFRGFRWPRGAEARRRLERKSELAHRPLAVLDDRPAGVAGIYGDSSSAALWRAHRQRAEAALKKLRSGLPAPGVAGLDPLALRAVPVLTLVVALAVAWGEIGDRLSRAAQPALAGAAAAPTLQLWITPPEYTALAPRFIDPAKTSKPISVPDGSIVMAQVHGGWGRPRLRLAGRGVEFRSLAGKSFEAKATLERSGRLRITQRGRQLARLDIEVIADRAPVIEYWKPPARTRRAALRLAYDVTDDYGVTGIKAIIRRRGAGAKDPLIELKLPLAGTQQQLKKSKGMSYHDLTAHRWAGLAVEVRLVASDARGQTGRTEVFTMILPERLFLHPVARAIVAERKRLTQDPSQRQDVASKLGALAAYPKRFFDDIVVYMALRSAQGRLRQDLSDRAVREVQDLLWDTALRIEDGKLSLAERELRDSQRALRDALDRGADAQEIERLLDRLQQALNSYLQALAKDMEKRPEKYGDRRSDLDKLRLQSGDLQRLIDRMRETARSGSRDAARQMLSRLQEMLENLRATTRRGGQQGREHPAATLLRDLQKLIGKQRKLLDQTFRQSQRLLSNPGAQPDTKRGAARQEGLRRQLGAIMRRLGEMSGNIPKALGQAERSMRDAGDALKRRKPGPAARAQGLALDALRRGGRAAAERLVKKFAGQMQGRPGPGRGKGQGRGQGRDPLGRPLEGFGEMDDGRVKIPDHMELQKAREILDELRRRAGQSKRPRQEHEYIDRLLRRF